MEVIFRQIYSKMINKLTLHKPKVFKTKIKILKTCIIYYLKKRA